MAQVRFVNVTKEFGETRAVDNLSLDIADKEFLVLVGPSGCGKSTALRMLSGLEDVTRGEIYIGDRLVNKVPPKDRDIAMVFQSYALYPHMTVFHNMAFALQLRKVPKDEIKRRVNEAAGILGIEDLLKRKPRQLSGGQRQRVALGRAIVREPAAFLLDEPLSNLDAKLRVQTRAQLSKLHERLGTTFVYVTHDQVEAMTMATRIAVLNKGRLQQVGTPGDLYEHPDNVFVAGFIGSPAMNFREVTVGKDASGIFIEAEGFHIPVPEEAGEALMKYVGQRVIFGIRPDDIHNPRYLVPGIKAQPVRAKVDITEMMGNEYYLHMLIGDWPFEARVDTRTEAKPGQEIELVYDMSKMHAFEVETEKTIL